METVSYILDLGIGKGGEYIRRDKPNERRIGLDISAKDLEQAKQTYGIEVRTCDINPDRLEFPDNTFKRADIILPFNKLLYLLAAEPNLKLWGELNRVLVNNGQINIIADDQKWGHTYAGPEGTIKMPYPPGMMFQNALKAGFRSFIDEISLEEGEELGTSYAVVLAHHKRLMEIIAIKTDERFLFVPRSWEKKWYGRSPRPLTSWLFSQFPP